MNFLNQLPRSKLTRYAREDFWQAVVDPALFYKVQEILKQAFGYIFRFGKNSAGFIISTPPHPRKRAHEVFGGQIIKKEDCVFCQIASNNLPSEKIYENDNVFVFADINPVNLGHSLVIPKKHYADMSETPDDTLAELVKVAKKIGISTKEALKADGINIEMNNGKAAGQIIFHSHIHVIPRFLYDGYRHWKGPEKTSEEIRNAVNKIKENIKQI